MTEDTKLGATGRYPDGKLNEDDEGELALKIGVKDGNVVLDFGKPVAWFAMPPDLAVDLAERLIARATKIMQERKRSLQ